MNFAIFHAAIASPALKQVAEHWNDARARRKMPAWSDIRPRAIAAHLPIVWSYKYDSVTAAFTGRLAGESITAIFGKSFRGVLLSETQPAADFPWMYALCKRVVIEPALYRSEGCVFNHLHRYGVGERIMLPLSSDGSIGDGVLGATEYRIEPNDFGSPMKTVLETEQWTSLLESN